MVVRWLASQLKGTYRANFPRESNDETFWCELAEGLSKWASTTASVLLEHAQALQEHWKKSISHRGVTLSDRVLGLLKRPHPTDPESVQVMTPDDPLMTLMIHS